MIFWLEKGVDGFRVDTIGALWKDERFLDEPVDQNSNGPRLCDRMIHDYTYDQQKVHDIIRNGELQS